MMDENKKFLWLIGTLDAARIRVIEPWYREAKSAQEIKNIYRDAKILSEYLIEYSPGAFFINAELCPSCMLNEANGSKYNDKIYFEHIFACYN